MTTAPPGIRRDDSGHPELDDDAWQLFTEHFSIFPWSELTADTRGLDFGAGAGRWASLVGQRVAHLAVVEPDPQRADLARAHLGAHPACVTQPDLAGIEDASLDFAYALSAVQAAEDPAAVLAAIARKLKPGAPLLTYLCYALDNRPTWYRAVWRASDLLREGIARQPAPARALFATALAAGAYWPVAKATGRLERLGVGVDGLPLATYRNASFATMREGALERFAARVQARFTAAEVRGLLREAGFERVRLSGGPPYWTALAYRARS